jgi:SAM-dependent methyltransferase
VPPQELLRAALAEALADAEAIAELAAGQRLHWAGVLGDRADRYGADPSAPAVAAAERFAEAGAADVLELGAGQGRDSVFFAREGFAVHALDFADCGVSAILAKAQAAVPVLPLRASVHDCREALPFPDASFDACYSHMLYCMALTTPQLEALTAEVRRVLRPGGLQVYTVRTTADADYQAGVSHGDDMREVGGFVVHFFNRGLVQRLARGFELLEVAEFEEGDLPRRLLRVTQRRPG